MQALVAQEQEVRINFATTRPASAESAMPVAKPSREKLRVAAMILNQRAEPDSSRRPATNANPNQTAQDALKVPLPAPLSERDNASHEPTLDAASEPLELKPQTSKEDLKSVPVKPESAKPESARSVVSEAEPLVRPSSPSPVGLDGREVACRAAEAWVPAKQLRKQSQTISQLYAKEDDCAKQAARVFSSTLKSQAAYQCDSAAATALRAYYGRIAVDEQLKVVDESVNLLNRQRQQQDAVAKQGVTVTIDLTRFDREQINLEDQRQQLLARREQLQSSLKNLANIQLGDHTMLEPMEIQPRSIDTNYLVDIALRQRHDLLSVEYLSQHITRETAPLLLTAVTGLGGGAALPLPKICWLNQLLGKRDYTCLAQNLRDELALAKEGLTLTIRNSVEEKSSVLRLAYQRVELADRTLESWDYRIRQLNRAAELGDARPADLAAAEASRLAALSDLQSRRLDAKLAEVDLAEVVGGLHQRCCNGLAWLIAGP